MSRSIPTPKWTPYSKTSFSYEVNSWLIRWSYRTLRSGLDLTEEALTEYCWKKISRYVVSDYDHIMGGGVAKGLGARVTETQATALVDGVVKYVLDNYSPAEFAALQAKRGRGNRRFHLSHLAKYAHLSIKQTAAVLECSTATVSRLRRQMKASALGRLTLLLKQAKPFPPRPAFSIPWGIEELAELHLSPGYASVFDIDLIPWRTT